MFQTAHVMGYVNHFDVIGTKEDPKGLALELETTFREKEGDNWVEKKAVLPVFIQGKRAKGLLKLENLVAARLFIEGGLRVGKKGVFVYAFDVMLVGSRKRDDQGAPSSGDDDIPF